MIGREIVLEMVRDGLANGAVTKADLAALIEEKVPVSVSPSPAMSSAAAVSSHSPEEQVGAHLSATDVLFYLAGVILYAALAVMASQAGDQSLLSGTILLVPGLLLWGLTYVLSKRRGQSETTQGLVGALLLTGCLAVISGGMVMAYQISGSYSSDTAKAAYVVAAALALLGGLHWWFDKVFRRAILVVFSMYLLVAAFPAALTGALSGASVPMDVWALIAIATGGLLGYGGIIVSKSAPGREHLKQAFLPVAGFVVLGSAYIASLASQAAVLWEVLLPLLIYGAFFYSVKRRSQQFLVTGSLFLALFLIGMSFKYFSGLGVAFCLVLSAVALLGTAILAADINRRYIKRVSA